MCVMSMVIDDWNKQHPYPYVEPYRPWTYPNTSPPYTYPSTGSITYYGFPQVTKDDLDKLRKEVLGAIDEFREALKAAKIVDQYTNQPDCESADKIATAKALLDLLGITAEDLFDEDVRQ